MIRFLSTLAVTSLLTISCSLSKQELTFENGDNYNSMSQLSVSDPSVWSSMISQRGFTLNDNTNNNEGSYRSIIQKGDSYPSWDDTSSPKSYVYTIFEDQFPNMGDYDFNDVIIKSIYTINEFTRDDDSNIEGWSGTIDSYLVNDGASYEFELVLMFYIAETKSDGVEYFTRIPNSQVQLEIDGTSIDYSSSIDPFKIEFSEFYKDLGDEMFNDYSSLANGGAEGKEVAFSITGIDNLSTDLESTKLWISTAIRVINTGQYILPAGYPDYNFLDEFEIGYKNYLLDIDGYTNIPFCLEFIASSHNTPSEGQFILEQNIDFLNNLPTTGDDPIGLEDSFMDSRDGKYYDYAKIGGQIWMTENLDYTEGITNVTDGYEWEMLSATDKAYAYYDNSSSVGYGALYTWAAAMNGASSTSASPSGIQGICPNGWHLPSIAEWEILKNYLIKNGYNAIPTNTTTNIIAKSMATKTGWIESDVSYAVGNISSTNNSSNFSGTPGGYRYRYGNSLCLGEFGYWWTTEESGDDKAYDYYLHSEEYSLRVENQYYKRAGFSIRCVKD